jgi:hypothetical protein
MAARRHHNDHHASSHPALMLDTARRFTDAAGEPK